MDAEGQNDGRATGRRRAAISLAIGGLAVVLGSFMTWSTCPDSSCGGAGGLPSFFSTSGVEFGLGIVTAVLGLQLALAGVVAYGHGIAAWWLGAALLSSVIVLLVIGAHLITRHIAPDHPLHGPNLGVYVVTIGALGAGAASAKLLRIR